MQIFCLWNRKSGKFLLVEFGIKLKESGSHYRLESEIQDLLTKTPESTVWNPESKTVLVYVTWGEWIIYS